LKFQPLALQHAPILHQLYLDTPDYFALLGTTPPSLGEVERDLQTALFDPRRCLELIYTEADPGGPPIGSLDYKLDFPESGDVTINLLLIRGDLQSSGLGQKAMRQFENRLHRRSPRMNLDEQSLPGAAPLQINPSAQVNPRLLASVLGENPRAVAFWQRLGFSFATDARPVMTWYAKPLSPLVGNVSTVGQDRTAVQDTVREPKRLSV
jgi:GNAT superfamily N-acetyltransferase